MKSSGPEILARTLSLPTNGGSGKGFSYGNSWQYHSRSDRHSKVACWGIAFDLLRSCELLRAHVSQGKVALGINHELRDFRNNKKKNLDLVVCKSSGAGKGGSKGGSKGSADFMSLANAYEIILSPSEVADLASLPRFPIGDVSTVFIATEAKAAMTAHGKARPRLKDELTSSFQTIHGDNESAIAAGIVMVNAAGTFVSPDLNKFSLSERPAVFTHHRQPRDAQLIVDGLRDLQRRARVGDIGFDALSVITLDCANDGTPVTLVSEHPPSPLPTDDFDYARFIDRIAHLYATRFSAI